MNHHPNPQFSRPNFYSLNGEWEFEFDDGAQYWKKSRANKTLLKRQIQVPFAPEAPLSGIGDREFHCRLWYAKNFTLPASFSGKHVLLHFGACDYKTTVFVNAQKVGEHIGGYTPFSFDITKFLQDGQNRITVGVADDTRDPRIPSGKQCPLYNSFSALYTRTSGIWQSVWLEACGENRIDHVRFTTRIDGEVQAQVAFYRSAVGCELSMDISLEGKPVAQICEPVTAFDYRKTIRIENPKLWEVGNGVLYDCRMTLKTIATGETVDCVDTYFGIREVGFSDNRFTLNGKPLFLRMVLDQGFYPDGIYTAPDDEALVNDIKIAMEMGFNGARLHEKIFDPRYLYHADRLGYLTFGEFPDMGLSIDQFEAISYMLPEWLAEMKRDINHPSIVAWCPFNETSTNDFFHEQLQCDRVIETVYYMTKQYDPSRPVFDTSGSIHTSVTDIYDVHEYTQTEEKFVENMGSGYHYNTYGDHDGMRDGQPYMVTEFGGIHWNVDDDGGHSWGYGQAPQTEEEFLTRFEMMMRTLLGNPVCTGFCYTQLYDVEQEKNGLYTYGRVPKFDTARIRAAVSAKAAMENEE